MECGQFVLRIEEVIKCIDDGDDIEGVRGQRNAVDTPLTGLDASAPGLLDRLGREIHATEFPIRLGKEISQEEPRRASDVENTSPLFEALDAACHAGENLFPISLESCLQIGLAKLSRALKVRTEHF